MECPNCGEPVGAKQKFCHECGTGLQKRQKFQDSGEGGGAESTPSTVPVVPAAAKLTAEQPDGSKVSQPTGGGGGGRNVHISSLSTDHNANMEINTMSTSDKNIKPMDPEPMETDSVQDEKGASNDGGSSEALKDGIPPDIEGSTSCVGGETPLPDDKRPVSPTVLADTLQKSVQLDSPVQETCTHVQGFEGDVGSLGKEGAQSTQPSTGVLGLEKGDVGSLNKGGTKSRKSTEKGQGDNQKSHLQARCPPKQIDDSSETSTAVQRFEKGDVGSLNKEGAQSVRPTELGQGDNQSSDLQARLPPKLSGTCNTIEASTGVQGLEKGDVGSLGKGGAQRSQQTELGQGDSQSSDLQATCPPKPPDSTAKDEQVTKTATNKSNKNKGPQKSDGKLREETVQPEPTEEKEPQTQAIVSSEALGQAKPAPKSKTKAFEQEIIHHPPKDEHRLEANKDTAHGEDQDKEKEKTRVQEESDQHDEDLQDMPFADTSMEDSVMYVGEDEGNSHDGPSKSADQDADGWQVQKSRKQKKREHKNRKRQEPVDNKAQKEQENQSHHTSSPSKNVHQPQQTGQYDGGATMTLHFHVLVSPDFKMKPDVERVHVRSDIVEWKSLAVLEITRDLKDGYLVAEGKCSVNLKRVSNNKYVSFKYAVVNQEGKVKWEFIHYNMGGGVIVNRCFKLSPEECQAGAEVHLYNDAMQVERGLKDKFKSFIGWSSVEEKVAHDRQVAVQAWLPQWNGFTCDQQGEEQLACDVMKQVEDVCRWVETSPVSDGYYNRRRWELREFSITKVLMDYIGPKLEQLAKEHKTESPAAAQARIVSALSICWLVHKFKLQLDFQQAHTLFEGLLIRPDVKDKSCHEVEAFSLHFFQDGRLKEVTNAVASLMNTAMSGDATMLTSRWLLALPVLHFLQNESTPFKPTTPTTDFQKASQKWWGLEGLKYGQFKKNINYRSAEKPLAVMEELDPALFDADALLERSFAAVLTNKELLDPLTVKTITLPTLCAAIAVNVANGYSLARDEDRQEILALVQTATALAASHVNDDNADKGDDTTRKEACQTFCIAHEVLMSSLDACTYLNRSPILIGAVHLAAACMTNLWQRVGSATEAKIQNMQTSMMKLVEEATSLVMRWMDKRLNVRISPYGAGEESKVWLGLLSVDWGKEEVNSYWNKSLLGMLRQRLDAISPMERVELFCSIDTSTFPQHLSQCFSDAAFEAVDNIVKSKNGQQIVASYTRSPNESKYKYGSLFSRMLCRTWPATNQGRTPPTNLRLLQHMLTWQPCAGILKLFGEASDLVEVLNEDSQTHIASYKSLLGTAIQELTKASIVIGHLQLILQHQRQFLELCSAVAVSSPQDEDKAKKAKGSGRHDANMVVKVGDSVWTVKQLEKVLDWRGKEMEAINTETRQIECFLSMCEDIKPVASKDLEQKVRRDTSTMSLNKLCQPVVGIDIAKVSFDLNQPPNVTHFGITPEFREMLSHLENLSKSTVFNKIWEKMRQTEPGEEEEAIPALSVDAVLSQVWKPAYQKWLELRQNLKDGNITLDEVDETFGQFKNEYRKLENELKMLAKNPREGWIKERVLQIQQYHKLNEHLDAADVVKDVKEKYNLKGDFKGVEVLLHSKAKNFKQNPLSSINRKVVNAGKLLADMTEERIESIRMFVKCQRLVDWLRTKIHDTKELKVFVDLASISAGESDIEVDKVNCLLSAGVGYAPLIYDLDEESDFDELMKCCRHFWAALEKDKHLPKKLRDTWRNLEWLKGVSDSHGSVEMSSLSQTEAINARGVYEIGCFGQNQALNDLESVVRLRVEGAESEEVDDEDMAAKELKEYNLSMLKSLQSKLMLLAGKADKGSQEVDRFVEILTGVTRLGQAYVHLYNAGAVLFNNWNAVVYCEGDRRVKVMVNFGFDTPVLYGTRAAVEEQLTQLAKYMEVCLEEWVGAMDKARLEYDELNHFTTEQIVVLRKALARMIDPSKTVTPQVLALLSSIKPLCAEEHIRRAMAGVAGDIDAMEEENVKEEPMMEEVGKKLSSMDDEEREEFMEKLKQLVPDLTERVAMAAMKATKGNVEEAVGWCISNMDDDDIIEEVLNDDEEEEKEEMVAAVEDVIPEMVEDSSIMLTSIQEPVSLAGFTSMSLSREEPRKETMIKRMESVWGEYLTTVKSTTFEEYISIDHLALVLRNLSSTANIAVGRQWPSRFLEAGKPNLVVCPQDDIWQTVLSLYMQGQTQQPLPSYREVLICTPHTSLEEVVLLWRRAVGDQTGGIFCLVAADQLDYDVSVRAEEMRCKLFQGKSGYHVVVVCTSERQHQSYMVTALDQYKVPLPHVPSHDLVQEYLLSQFQQQDAGSAGLASAVDHQRSSVRVISSQRAGVGKSLVVQRLSEELKKKLPRSLRGRVSYIKVPLHEATVNNDAVLEALLPHSANPASYSPRIIHLDISPLVHNGVDCLLFNLLVLGSLVGRDGAVWRRLPWDMYVVEHTYKPQATDAQKTREEHKSFVSMLPSVTCISPRETYNLLTKGQQVIPGLRQVDDMMFRSVEYQRPYQYLRRWMANTNLETFVFTPSHAEGSHQNFLHTVLSYCGMEDPSWAELLHFLSFLNYQLQDYENSAFCLDFLRDTLPGFRKFVVQFMIIMSKDFATPSLNMSDQSPSLKAAPSDDQEQAEIQQFQLRRTWETSPHPYLFFNADHNTMTFLGFYVDRAGSVIDASGQLLEQNVITGNLYQGLTGNGVKFNANFDDLSRFEKIQKLCFVMGIHDVFYDPDPSYELTTDNVKKILAIQMRFRCNIPVIIMGETGCGKTRLIRFMCDLQAGHVKGKKHPENMIIMKVHGGVRADDIIRKVEKAQQTARINRERHNIDTVLFFDEANTTEAIGLIKEIMCDGTIAGQPLNRQDGCLKIVAAINPYRRHTDDMIRRLEEAGLGYHIKATETKDRFGHIPLRQLVYRVQPLPPSMLPLVWDFGQLRSDVEEKYIVQMVNRCVKDHSLPANTTKVVSAVLAASQRYMRSKKDECSFVSLRDAERTLTVLCWFYKMSGKLRALMPDTGRSTRSNAHISDFTRALVLAIGVCYHSRLETRKQYRKNVAQHFTEPCQLPQGPQTVEQEIDRCQDAFLEELKDQLGANIACNTALKENVFMMVVCIELQIPLFLVGKPGSSKSLAKTIVADAMQGDSAPSTLFKGLKQAQMVSFQCSPLATPEGIVGTFRQCSKFQKDKDLSRFVSVVVLDEVGLAEDSPKMPLKTLHPLLEDGYEQEDQDEEKEADDSEQEEEEEEDTPDQTRSHRKVAFVGISNWALDPAKMNRGIFVSRGKPRKEDLTKSARGICENDHHVLARMKTLLPHLCEAYLKLYNDQDREFFGLRDFYSLVKMVYGFCKTSERPPTKAQVVHAVLRNYGGRDDMDPLEKFGQVVGTLPDDKHADDPDCTPSGLIRASVQGMHCEGESRYLMVLTQNYAALGILQQELLTMSDTVIIFGSSFPKDLEYTQVCRNINRIKVCMETGRTVVLLNLENLYESLYDALNQYYVYFGGQRYVDLGLGTHRVKCRVHQNFRLVVVAEKDIVYERFPIPLINRLEKHFLAISTVLTPQQKAIAHRLEMWAKAFATRRTAPHEAVKYQYTVGDAFVGYHPDTAATLVFQVCSEMSGVDTDDPAVEEEILQKAQDLLLQCATPDAVVRLSKSRLSSEEAALNDKYFHQQHHSCLQEFLCHRIDQSRQAGGLQQGIQTQITTHSKLLSHTDAQTLAAALGLPPFYVAVMSLQQFDTEHQFCKQIRDFLTTTLQQESILIVQCDSGHTNSNLIACARYCVQDEQTQVGNTTAHLVFIVQLPRLPGGCFVGFQGGKWTCAHIDDLQPPHRNAPDVAQMRGKPISQLLGGHRREEGEAVSMDVDAGEEGNLPERSVQMEEEMPVPGAEPGVGEDMDVDEDEEPQGSSMEEGGDAHEGMDLDDIELELTAEKEEINPEPKTTDKYTEVSVLDDKMLLVSCIQATAAMLEDPKDLPKRRTVTRIEKLMQLLLERKEKGPSFCGVVKARIVQLLEEKEKSKADGGVNWLTNEAATPKAITEAGTLRQSAWNHLSSVIAPLLAEIVAYADRNSNLDHMATPAGEWTVPLFLDVLSDHNLVPFHYNAMLSPVMNVQRQKIPVLSSGCGEQLFECRVPFSWVIRGQVDAMWKTAQKLEAKTGETPDQALPRLFEESPLGKIIQTAAEQDQEEDIAARYLHDFVWMAYRMVTTSVEEIKMVCSAVEMSAEELYDQSGTEEPFCLTIPAVHTAFSRVQGRLLNLSQLLETTPVLLEKLCTLDFDSDTSMTVDTAAVLAVLEGLTPDAHDVTTPAGRQTWLGRMLCVAPVVERVFAAAASPDNSGCYGEKSLTQVHMARFLWIRLQTLQMFMEHMFTAADSEESLSTKQMEVLWKVLCNEPQNDFKSVKTMKKVERFLKSCNSQAGIKHFSGGVRDCMVCKEGLREPVKLPCDHVGCQQCLRRWLTPDKLSCPLCRAAVPEDFQFTVTLECREAVEKHNAYRRCCNSFFMELVSRFCFAGGTPPEAGVVEMLLNYVVRRSQEGTAAKTKQFTPFEDDCIDQTPVIRSFLLQLLLRANSQEVIDHMEKYLQAARDFVVDKKEVIELLVIFIQCMEDSYKQEAAQSHDTETAMVEVAVSKLQQAGRQAQRNAPGLSVATLLFIANIRFGLSVGAQLLHKYHGQQALSVQVEKKLMVQTHYRLTKRLLDQAWRLCEQLQWRWPQVFLLKQLYRSCGMDSLLSVTEQAQVHQHLQWVIPPEARGGKEEIIPDRFIVCGEQYRQLREELAKSMVSKNMEAVNTVLQAINIPGNVREVQLLLSLYREVTVSRANSNQARHPTRDYITVCHQYLHDSPLLANKQLALELLTNNQGGGNLLLSVTLNQPPIQRTLSALVIHTAAVLGTGVGGVLLPLQTLLQNPQNHARSYFPTMPEDVLMEARRALGEREAQPLHWFQCVNGHPYPIGECGQPMEQSRCPDCGAAIGGVNHRPVQGLQAARNNDATRPGHILGPAATRPAVPIAERALSTVATCVVRLVMHAAMVKAATNNPQGFANVIDPRPPNPSDFLWRHLELDLQQLGRALGRSADDAALFMHLILHNLLTPGVQAAAAGDWSSKDSRRRWEEIFMATCVNPILHQGLDAMLQQANMALHNDDRLSNNPLLQLLSEVVTPTERLNLDRLADLPEMWRHRPQINLESLTQTMAENQLQLPVLEKFLAEKEVLEAMRHLPDILRLQRLLITQYQGHIDVAEAMSIKISDFLNKQPEGAVYEEFRLLVESFRVAWNLTRHLLARTTSQAVPRELCQKTFDPIRTSLYHLLPIKRTVAPTSCSTALVLFLANAHNSFVQETQGHAAVQNSSGRSVLLSDVNSAHVVACHPEQDLLPLVLSHCCYSLAVGEGTRVEYDLPALERQLVERFVSGKPRINDEFETFVFRQETKNVAMYKSLRDKVPQEPLSKAVQMHILQELGTLTNVCSSLAAVDIALIFLATTGGDPNTPLREYLHRVLKMKATAGLHSDKANQHCRLKHILSLWQLLAVQRARMSLENGQDPFEDMPKQYNEKLDKSETKTLKEALRHINVDTLLAELYELIAVAEEQTRLPEWSMLSTLSAYIDDKDTPEVEGLDEHFPPTILLKHAYYTWRMVARYRPHEDQGRDANRLRH
ncbi:E3 ubiquitin-protein ligase RNF213-like isoform X3 [Branchiostoma lanceolatum]|uniref:E3 ubiquitin-protein ligase RNF213-like isoform X3 n=1 Tax=Branchiostoma lanceolatum TaxID=7740 RepID=UPI003455D27D